MAAQDQLTSPPARAYVLSAHDVVMKVVSSRLPVTRATRTLAGAGHLSDVYTVAKQQGGRYNDRKRLLNRFTSKIYLYYAGQFREEKLGTYLM